MPRSDEQIIALHDAAGGNAMGVLDFCMEQIGIGVDDSEATPDEYMQMIMTLSIALAYPLVDLARTSGRDPVKLARVLVTEPFVGEVESVAAASNIVDSMFGEDDDERQAGIDRAFCTLEAPCCDRRDEYNGFGSDSPLKFTCPQKCSCHD